MYKKEKYNIAQNQSYLANFKISLSVNKTME